MSEQSLFEQAQLELAERQSASIQSSSDEEQDKKTTLAEKFVLFVQERAALFHDENREAYATVNATGHTYKVGSSAFDDWLCASLMNESGIVAREQPRREAVQTLRGIARHKGEELAVWLRCGVASDGAYVVDLCQPDNSNAVVVHPGNWDLVAVPPVRFVRNPDSLPLPAPTKGGDLSPLWRVVNIPEDMRSLVLAWLLESFRPDTPFPVLELIGEEGTAKSTTQNALRNLIDPNRVNLRAAPRNREDLCTSAAVNWLVSYENLSHLNPDLQDALCTVATGGGFATRKLYTTGEETTLKFKRPVILNGISAVVTQQDLLGRAVSLELPRIVMRQDDSETQATYKNNHAQMLGAVFDLLAAALAELPTIFIHPEAKPRMADFCRLGMAMEKALGGDPHQFYTKYADMHRDSIQRTIDSSPVAAAIMALLENEPFGITAPPVQILQRLNPLKPERCDSWPRSGKGMADALRRLSPAFSKLGVDIRKRDDLSRRDGHQWEISKSKTLKTTSPTSLTSRDQPVREHGERGEHDSRVYDTPLAGDDCELF